MIAGATGLGLAILAWVLHESPHQRMLVVASLLLPGATLLVWFLLVDMRKPTSQSKDGRDDPAATLLSQIGRGLNRLALVAWSVGLSVLGLIQPQVYSSAEYWIRAAALLGLTIVGVLSVNADVRRDRADSGSGQRRFFVVLASPALLLGVVAVGVGAADGSLMRMAAPAAGVAGLVVALVLDRGRP